MNSCNFFQLKILLTGKTGHGSLVYSEKSAAYQAAV